MDDDDDDDNNDDDDVSVSTACIRQSQRTRRLLTVTINLQDPNAGNSRVRRHIECRSQ